MAYVFAHYVFIGLGPQTSRKAANLAVTDGPPRTYHLVDYGNIEKCYYGSLVNTEECV